jgi:hypothetical protein
VLVRLYGEDTVIEAVDKINDGIIKEKLITAMALDCDLRPSDCCCGAGCCSMI